MKDGNKLMLIVFDDEFNFNCSLKIEMCFLFLNVNFLFVFVYSIWNMLHVLSF